ncbi:MAG: penicillin-binding transpeptidase domain-containing protein, partial [Pseudomonadota bacterium]
EVRLDVQEFNGDAGKVNFAIIGDRASASMIGRIEGGVFRNEDLPWERRDHALFVGFAPYDDPRYAVTVIVEHGGGGSKAAAPIARDVMMRALWRGEPPLAAYPPNERRRIQEERMRPPAPRPAAPDAPVVTPPRGGPQRA